MSGSSGSESELNTKRCLWSERERGLNETDGGNTCAGTFSNGWQEWPRYKNMPTQPNPIALSVSPMGWVKLGLRSVKANEAHVLNVHTHAHTHSCSKAPSIIPNGLPTPRVFAQRMTLSAVISPTWLSTTGHSVSFWISWSAPRSQTEDYHKDPKAVLVLALSEIQSASERPCTVTPNSVLTPML